MVDVLIWMAVAILGLFLLPIALNITILVVGGAISLILLPIDFFVGGVETLMKDKKQKQRKRSKYPFGLESLDDHKD